MHFDSQQPGRGWQSILSKRAQEQRVGGDDGTRGSVSNPDRDIHELSIHSRSRRIVIARLDINPVRSITNPGREADTTVHAHGA